MKTDRRSFLLSTAGLAAGALAAGGIAPAATKHTDVSAEQGLRNLLAGNARFAEGKPTCLSTTARRAELANGQAPFAAVLGCADSRIPVETVFDHNPGDIFVVRVAGYFADDVGIGSLEYAVAALGTPLIMVLGHTSCGAVTAATQFVKTGKGYPGHIQTILNALAPIAKATQHQAGDWPHNAELANVRANVAKLKASKPILSEAVAKGKLQIAGAIYNLHTGRVSLV